MMPSENQKRLSPERSRALWAAGAVIAATLAALLVARCGRRPDHAPRPPDESVIRDAPTAPPPSSFTRIAWPTPQTNLLTGPIEQVFQATASGRIESASYGSTRTANTGGRTHPSFHEGIDIAPVSRDRAGRTLDTVFAVADGRVGYLNRSSGDSNYGIYAVLLHDDPVGEVYTLYAHLADIRRELAVGQAVRAGDALGRMGNTPSSIVPVSRSHVHFEVGLMLNARFESWLAARKTPNPHGRHHGWNLLGCHPLEFLRAQSTQAETFSMLRHLAEMPPAFEMVVPAKRLPDFFTRYPKLWQGGAFRGTAIVVTCSENGIPLRGRLATVEEAARVIRRTPVVIQAWPEVLGANGRRIVAAKGDAWALGSQAADWVAMLTH